jgi:hypothetical protein
VWLVLAAAFKGQHYAGGRRIRGRADHQGDLLSAEFEAGTVGLRQPTLGRRGASGPAMNPRWLDSASIAACRTE